MSSQVIVSEEEWLRARIKLLKQEKEFNRQRDSLSLARQTLPWVKIEKHYRLIGPHGQLALADLFEGRSQLIIYHFMYHESWDQGCVSCSFWADNFDGIDVHLNARDVSFAAVSQAPMSTLDAYKKRMGWSFNWVSSHDSDFSRDFHVSFDEGESEDESTYYNYKHQKFPSQEAPGVSVLVKSNQGEICHSYSTYSRGLDMLNGAYHYLDLVPKGRDEATLPWSMSWLSRNNEYT